MHMGYCCACQPANCLQLYLPRSFQDSAYRFVGTGTQTLGSAAHFTAGLATNHYKFRDYEAGVSPIQQTVVPAIPLVRRIPIDPGTYRLPVNSYVNTTTVALNVGSSFLYKNYPSPATFNGHIIDLSAVEADIDWTTETPFPQCSASGLATNILTPQTSFDSGNIYDSAEMTLEWENCLLNSVSHIHDYYYDTFTTVGLNTHMSNSEIASPVKFRD